MAEATIALMRARLSAALAPSEIRIVDDRAHHAGHAGAASGGGHYQLHLRSAAFSGLARVARHRLVYDALHDLMKRDIHALAMTLLAPDESPSAPAPFPDS